VRKWAKSVSLAILIAREALAVMSRAVIWLFMIVMWGIMTVATLLLIVGYEFTDWFERWVDRHSPKD